MNNRKKQIAIIIIGIAIGILLAILFAVKKEPTRQTPKEKEVRPIQPPKVTSDSDARFAIELALSPEKLSVPPQLPIYQLSTLPMTSNETVSIAAAMGFKTSPFTLNDANLGTVLVWIDNLRTLRIVLATQLIDYKSGVPPELSTESFPEDQQLVSTAKDFLTQRGLFPMENVKFDEIRYLVLATEDAKVTIKEKANIANVIFSQQLNNYPIVNATPGAGNISVAISNDGKILSALIDKTATIVSSSEYPIKTFSDLKSSLDQAKLQLLDQGNIDITVLSSNPIKKIAVQEISIAYFQENSPTQSLLQPIFILKGTAELISGKQVPALLYLPAVSSKLFPNQ